jgi:S-adenosylmethionine:tRNA ribosyltransferase-isomerase
MTSVDDFNYDLPEHLIAQKPTEPRDAARLLYLDRTSGDIRHGVFQDLIDELKTDDLLVLNKTKVFKARLIARAIDRNLGELEIVLLHEIKRDRETSTWEILLKHMRKLRIGDRLQIGDEIAEIVSKNPEGGTAVISFQTTYETVLQLTDKLGEVPLPPYINTELDDLGDYQTVYAETVGSVAAPTAGLHFTDDLMSALKKKGVQFEFITLHVGLGTFQPMWFDTIEEHQMHSEFVEIDAGTAGRINMAKKEGRRIIAVGTTSTRSLEGAITPDPHDAIDTPVFLPPNGFTGDVNIFIKPGYKFNIIDGIITNFHLPRTTLMVLVSAFTGHEYVMDAYKEAIKEEYRFYSFGDAMLIV